MRPMRAWAWVAAVVLSGCGLSTQVRPTPRGVLVAEASVGGPGAILDGAPVPIPMSAVGVSWGFGPKSDLSAHTHITTLLAQRVAGFDVGGSWLVFDGGGARPALCFGGGGYLFSDFRSSALGFVDAALTASWVMGRFVPFVSFATQLSSSGLAVDFAPAIGTQVRFSRFTLALEVRWYAPTQDTRGAAVQWLSPLQRGAIGLVLGGRYALTDGLTAGD